MTGCTSDTRGLSNSVSSFLESVANSTQETFESISGEDMLAKTKVFNKDVKNIKQKWEKRREAKLAKNCGKCCIMVLVNECQKRDKHEKRKNPTDKAIRGEEEINCKVTGQEQPNQEQEDNIEIENLEEKPEMKEILASWDCGDCGVQIQRRVNRDCEECGMGISEEELKLTLLGLDVVGLFPAMKSATTGIIVRKMILRSSIKIEGFQWKHGIRYIALNKHLTGDLGVVGTLLPWTKSGCTVGMKNKNVNAKKETIEDTWVFPRNTPTEIEIREIVARVAEIAMRAIFENFNYNFGQNTYQQASGGPIGARVTMAAARLVMQDWGFNVRATLEMAKMEVALLSGYVDDVRQGGTSLRLGLRFDIANWKWTWSEEALKEDEDLRKAGENRDMRMVRLCLPICNNINRDLEFTAEVADEFENKRLPTLDFEMWLEDEEINHSYYQKPMKTPFVIMKRSAVSQHQKIQILSNEIVRRLSNVNHHKIPREEISGIMEVFIREIKTSGYERSETREVVVCGITGWQRKVKRREEEGRFYRSARSTLTTRCRKKQLEKTSWYKKTEKGKRKIKMEKIMREKGERRRLRKRNRRIWQEKQE